MVLLERAHELRPVGAGLTLAPNAVRALDWLRVGRRLRELGLAQGPSGIRTAAGRWLVREDIDQIRRRFGIAGYMVHRAELHEILADALRRTDLHTGHEVTGVDPHAGTVTFQRFNGEAGTISGDLVVAADGLGSSVRTSLFPSHPGPSYAGYLTWRGLVPAGGAAYIELGGVLTETWGRGQRFGIVPLLDGQVYWFATLTAPPGSQTTPVSPRSGIDLLTGTTRFPV